MSCIFYVLLKEIANALQEIKRQIQEKKISLGILQNRKDEAEAKANGLKLSFENLCGMVTFCSFLLSQMYLYLCTLLCPNWQKNCRVSKRRT